MKRIATLAVATLLAVSGTVLAAAPAAEAATPRFTTCEQFSKKYPKYSGVAKTFKIAQKVTGRQIVSGRTYAAARHLDRDRNGVACDRGDRVADTSPARPATPATRPGVTMHRVVVLTPERTWETRRNETLTATASRAACLSNETLTWVGTPTYTKRGGAHGADTAYGTGGSFGGWWKPEPSGSLTWSAPVPSGGTKTGWFDVNPTNLSTRAVGNTIEATVAYSARVGGATEILSPWPVPLQSRITVDVLCAF